jgi:hypothetical protein
MAVKKLSPSMEKVLLTANTDGWIASSDAPTSTAVALISRELISTLTVDDHGSLYPLHGHWLTLDGKAKVAELRGETPVDTRIADPVEAYGLAMAEYVVRDGNPDNVMPVVPEIRAGDLIEVCKPGERRMALRVSRVDLHNGHAWLRGIQVRMSDGRETRARSVNVKPGEYTIVERTKPAAKPMCECGTEAKSGRAHGKAVWMHADYMTKAHDHAVKLVGSTTVAVEQSRPARVTATVADDDNVPVLSKAQIDGLHWIGATGVPPFRSERPTRPTVNALRRFKLVAEWNLELTEAGRAAYLAHEPTGRLTKPFGDAWRAAQAQVAATAEVFADAGMDPEKALRNANTTFAAPDDQLPHVRALQAHRRKQASRTELPTLNELLRQIRLYRSTGDPTGPKYHAIREALEALYRETGR